MDKEDSQLRLIDFTKAKELKDKVLSEEDSRWTVDGVLNQIKEQNLDRIAVVGFSEDSEVGYYYIVGGTQDHRLALYDLERFKKAILEHHND